MNTAPFEGAMQRLRQGVREGLISPDKGTLTVQGRLLAERCQELTPPRNRQQGQAAVARDLTQLYFPLSASTFTNKRLQKVVRTDNRPDWNAAAENFSSAHGLAHTKAMAFSEALHAANFRRNGRGTVGNKKYLNKGLVTLGPEAAAARRYIKKIKDRVGWARAGWNAGIRQLGGKAPPAWVDRHGSGHGFITDGRADPNPFIGVTNMTGWAQNNRGDGERIIRNAVNGRIRDMYSYYEQMMKVAAAKAMGQSAA